MREPFEESNHMLLMIHRTAVLTVLLAAAAANSARAADYRVELLNERAPADELGPKVAGLLNAQGFRVIRGTSRTICDIWLCKKWVLPTLEAAGDVNYPLQVGQLVGVVRLSRKWDDFRGQEIDSGVYTLRYAQQPVDGSHIGTSPTRDFLLLAPAKEDDDPADTSYEDLTKASAKAAGANHPAMISLQKHTDAAAPSIHAHAEHEWSILTLQGEGEVKGQAKPLLLDLIIVGQAEG